MLVQVPDVLTREQVKRFREALDATEWVDGKVTAGYQSARVKDNAQLAPSRQGRLTLNVHF